MSRRLQHLIENESKIKVAQHAQEDSMGKFWSAALVASAAGVFYFWSYYFFGAMGSVLAGN